MTSRGWPRRRARRLPWLSSRLSREGRILLVLASLALLFGADLGRSQAHVLPLATFSLITAALLVSRAYRVPALRISVSMPERVAIGDELCITLELTNPGPADICHLRTELPRLSDGRFTARPDDIQTLASGARQRVELRARFTRRGAHQLDPFRVAALVPFGLAHGAPHSVTGVSFMVVPKVARVTRVGAPLEQRYLGGAAEAARAGDATELAGVRPYRAGDALRDLHARSWARHGEPMVRQYREECFSRVALVLDTDSTKQDEACFEAALSLAAGIIARLCRGEALVDVLLVGDRTERLALGRHEASLERALDVLATAQREPGFSSERSLARLAPHFGQLSCVAFVALDWDASRAELAAALEGRGIATMTYVVGGRRRQSARVLGVPVEHIERGEELAL